MQSYDDSCQHINGVRGWRINSKGKSSPGVAYEMFMLSKPTFVGMYEMLIPVAVSLRAA